MLEALNLCPTAVEVASRYMTLADRSTLESFIGIFQPRYSAGAALGGADSM
jgi:hypothetical protein